MGTQQRMRLFFVVAAACLLFAAATEAASSALNALKSKEFTCLACISKSTQRTIKQYTECAHAGKCDQDKFDETTTFLKRNGIKAESFAETLRGGKKTNLLKKLGNYMNALSEVEGDFNSCKSAKKCNVEEFTKRANAMGAVLQNKESKARLELGEGKSPLCAGLK